MLPKVPDPKRFNAPKQGQDSETKSGKGHFVGLMQKLAKKRATDRGGKNAPAQGNVLTKKAPMGASPVGSSKASNSTKVHPTDGQLGLNPKQQGR